MKLKHFKIERFRSIKSTGWLPFSEDGITVLVGQNESGKSSILDALHLGFAVKPTMQDDDFRMGEDLPEIAIGFSLNDEDIDSIAEDLPEGVRDQIYSVLDRRRNHIELIARITKGPKYSRAHFFPEELWEEMDYSMSVPTDAASAEEGKEPSSTVAVELTHEKLAALVFAVVPAFVLFKDEQCQLPNRIDIASGSLAPGIGHAGASNFLRAAGLGLANLLALNDRGAATALSRANEGVTGQLQAFWSQLLGQTRKIKLECELRHKPTSVGENVGEPYLVFWVSESGEKLYPSQRSKGTRWFISFFLQLIARRINPYGSVILLDEPGAFLHASAQRDVVRLIEHLSKEMPVIYSTHSPYLIDHRSLHRILAVERLDDADESPTCVRRGLEISAASPLTLAPILALIGVDLSQQQVIKKERNVILEEVSAYYYFLAMAKLLDREGESSFVAATGADSVKLLVDLFIAWGIDFAILVDDDPHGKKVAREIKAKYSMSDDFATRRLLRLSGCEGVEDMFEPGDFSAFVARREMVRGKRNSALVKEMKLSKPLLATSFYDGVVSGSISKDHISTATKQSFAKIFDAIAEGFAEIMSPLSS